MIFLNKCFVLSLFAFGFATAHAQTTVTIFEFYNSNLKQYFRTASAGEAQAIDGGAAGAGWSRTGDNFSAWTADSAGADLVDVCRFYGSQSPGPNSHFFTASAAECAALKSLQQSTPASQPRWNFEGVAFKAKLTAANGLCAAGTTPIYRSYNKGNAKGIDSNHRFTTQLSEYDRLNASGWAGEGVVMCVNAALTQAASTTSWKRLVEKVITPQCASCHSATGTGAQSGLRLDGNAAEIYKLLINVAPTNAGAAGHGMKRIVPGKSNDSFFYTKLLQWNPAITHAFGSPMPLGSQSLPVGTLEFIKQWIDAGA